MAELLSCPAWAPLPLAAKAAGDPKDSAAAAIVAQTTRIAAPLTFASLRMWFTSWVDGGEIAPPFFSRSQLCWALTKSDWLRSATLKQIPYDYQMPAMSAF